MKPELQFEDAKYLRAQGDDVLTLVNIVVASVPIKFGNDLIRKLTNKYPLENLKHLKRVKKSCSDKLEIIVCEAPFPDFTAEHLKDDALVALHPALGFVRDNGVENIYVTQASNGPPRDKVNVPKWNEHWPILWRIPENLSEIELNPGLLKNLQSYFERYMNVSFEILRSPVDSETPLTPCCINAAVIVDPATNLIVGKGVDRTQVHPLHHAVMVAINAVSKGSGLQLGPGSDEVIAPKEEQAIGSTIRAEIDDHHPASSTDLKKEAAVCGDFPSSEAVKKSAKRQKLEAGGAPLLTGEAEAHAAEGKLEGRTVTDAEATIVSPSIEAGESLGNDPPRPATDSPAFSASLNGADTSNSAPQVANPGPDSKQPSTSATSGSSKSKESSAQMPEANRPYMCTGFDCFVVQEPCVMCAMAMVHSRIQRVIYCNSDPEYGALGGNLKLHSQRSLNHHYEVFQLRLRDAPVASGEPSE